MTEDEDAPKGVSLPALRAIQHRPTRLYVNGWEVRGAKAFRVSMAVFAAHSEATIEFLIEGVDERVKDGVRYVNLRTIRGGK